MEAFDANGWNCMAAEERRQAKRYDIELPSRISIRARRRLPTYLKLSGCVVSISSNGMLLLLDEFREEFFEDLTSEYRFAVIRPDDPPNGFPKDLFGYIVGVRYKRKDLPLCQVALAFRDLDAKLQARLDNYLERLEEAARPGASMY